MVTRNPRSPKQAGPAKQSGLGSWGKDRLTDQFDPEQVQDYGHGLFGENKPPATPLTTSWKYPDSSRVRAYMYDYSSNSLYITWQNGKTPWVYDDVYPSLFEAFDAAPSKGKYINSTLNYTSHYPASSSEMDMFTGV